MDKKQQNDSQTNPRRKAKQIAAWICILALAALYIATFLTAILDTPGSGTLFRTCLGATIVLPTLLWMYLWLYDRLRNRNDDRP